MNNNTTHEVLIAVLRVASTDGSKPVSLGLNRSESSGPHVGTRLEVLLWQHGLGPASGQWALPGGRLLTTEDIAASAHRQLSEKVDVHELRHLEQLAVFSDPHRVPDERVIASAFLGVLPSHLSPHLPADTKWWDVQALPATAFDHAEIVSRARLRLAGKLSYSNLGFALAPPQFTMSTLRDHYSAALGHPVDATNLQRVLTRRGELERTGRIATSGSAGGRPGALFRFVHHQLRITDQFAALRPPSH